MNDDSGTQLKILVERVVRPLAVTSIRKRQLREELLAHVTEVFHAELERGGDERAALAAARRRFGDPGTLAAELQRGASRRERWGVFMEKITWRPGDPIVRGAAKIALLMAASFLSAGLASLVVMLVAHKSRFVADAPRLFAMLAVVSWFWTFGLVWFAERFANWLYSEPPGRRPVIGRIWLALSLTFLPALAFSVYWAATFDPRGSAAHAAFACLFAPVAPVIFWLCARDIASQLRYRREWESLAIDEDSPPPAPLSAAD